MIEKFSYQNHMGEIINFGEGKIFVNQSDMHDYSWGITSKNDRIAAFKKGIVKKTIPLIIICESEEEGIIQRNRIFELMEKDVLSMQYGKIIIGDYYLKCYCTGSKKQEYLISRKMMTLSLEIQTDFPMWCKEVTTTFNYGGGSQGTDLDFNNDFPYDYTSNMLGQTLNNQSFVPQNFRITIYGPATNPKITIAGHEYEVFEEFEANENLVIDSRDKTIVLTDSIGNKENCFNLRNKDSYIFEKVPVGQNAVAANGNFLFDITILEERGEPKWT